MAPEPGCAMDIPSSPKKLAGRYEVRQVLGQGGMGLVYRAYDTVVRREVAVKTILDIPDPASLQLFYKECDVLASMSHPNIVEIFDIGEFVRPIGQPRACRRSLPVRGSQSCGNRLRLPWAYFPPRNAAAPQCHRALK